MRDEMETLTGDQLDVGISKRSLAGEQECGDAYFVRAGPLSALLAVVDGIGHGPEAAAAARAAVDVLSSHATAPLEGLMDRCHLAVRELRGLTMGIARIETGESSMTWLGVGSVQGVLLHAAGDTAETRESLCVGRGLVGYRLTRLMPVTRPFRRGDLLLMATDGLTKDFGEGAITRSSAQDIADRVMERYATGQDDALVLAAWRLRGRT